MVDQRRYGSLAETSQRFFLFSLAQSEHSVCLMSATSRANLISYLSP